MAFDAAALWWPPFQKLYTQVRRSFATLRDASRPKDARCKGWVCWVLQTRPAKRSHGSAHELFVQLETLKLEPGAVSAEGLKAALAGALGASYWLPPTAVCSCRLLLSVSAIATSLAACGSWPTCTHRHSAGDGLPGWPDASR